MITKVSELVLGFIISNLDMSRNKYFVDKNIPNSNHALLQTEPSMIIHAVSTIYVS